MTRAPMTTTRPPTTTMPAMTTAATTAPRPPSSDDGDDEDDATASAASVRAADTAADGPSDDADAGDDGDTGNPCVDDTLAPGAWVHEAELSTDDDGTALFDAVALVDDTLVGRRRRPLASTGMLVEIWSDIACPWCYVGRARFAAALAQFEHRDEVTRARGAPSSSTPTRPPSARAAMPSGSRASTAARSRRSPRWTPS